MGLFLLGSPFSPLRFASATGFAPVGTNTVALPNTAATVRWLTRGFFTFGSGDLSQLVLSYFAFCIANSVFATSGYTIEAIALEYNGTSAPITFSGLRSKVINSGDTDILSDPLLPSAFGLTKFARGSTAYIRGLITFSNPATDTAPNSYFWSRDQSSSGVAYNPALVTVTNGVDSTGQVTVTGGAAGDQAFLGSYIMPAVLGRYIAGDPGTWITIGDSKTFGIGDTATTIGVQGLSRAFFPDPTLPANGISNWNIGVSGGVAQAWQLGTPSLLTAYLKYAKYAIENYGTNGTNFSWEQSIYTQLLAGGVRQIIRTSLTPKVADPTADNYASETFQIPSSGWSNGGSTDVFEQALKALVSSTFTYIDTAAVRGSTHWLWITNGTAFYSTVDGLHQSAAGYELTVGGASQVTTTGGTVSGTLRDAITALP